MRKNIEELLGSNLSSIHIAKKTKVNVSVISRIRNGERGIGKLTLDTVEKLNEYAKEFLNKNNQEIKGLQMKLKEINSTLNDYNLLEDEEKLLLSKKRDIENEIDDLLLK